MFFPLVVSDFLDRAEHVYPDRIGAVDEPDQPAPSLGDLTYRQIGELARAQAAKLDSLDVPVGARVAFVSENSARLYTSFFGVSGFGRILVPINFRLSHNEIRYIVGHSGADIVYADPAHRDVLDVLDVKHKFVLGDDDDLYLRDAAPKEWPDADEGATATINYTSGTTARPKGVQLTHRNNWLNATVFGLHTTISDRDVYLHTLPQFHANGWGMPFAMTGVGAQHVMLRKVDGAEILRRIERHGITVMCAAPAVIAAALDAAADWDGPIPGHGRVRIVAAGAPPPTRTIERVLDELGWEFIQVNDRPTGNVPGCRPRSTPVSAEMILAPASASNARNRIAAPWPKTAGCASQGCTATTTCRHSVVGFAASTKTCSQPFVPTR